MALGSIDGEIVIIILHDDPAGATPFSVVRLSVIGEQIVAITDYIKSPWVIDAAETISIA